MNPTKQKVLLLLNAGFDFFYVYHPGRKWQILENTYYKWHNINYEALKKELEDLYQSQYIEKQSNLDGSFSIFLTNKGKIKTLNFKFQDLIKNKKWDRKWRMVIFDVPEKIRQGRNVLRRKIKEIGFYRLQDSVFVFPYECKKEIDTIVKFFRMEKYVQYGILESIDGDFYLKKVFGLK